MNMHSRGAWIRHVNVLNLFIIAAAIGFYIYFLNPLLMTPVSLELPSPKEMSLETESSADQTKEPSISDYTLIAEQNLFHPDRLIPLEKTEKTEKKAAQSAPRPELVLHGTMILNGLKMAYVEDKKAASATPGRGTRQLVVKEGDSISGFILKQVTESMIVLVNGEEQMILYLDEMKDRKGEIPGSTRVLPSATTVQPSAIPRQQSLSPPVQRTPATPSVPQATSSSPSGLVSQPPSTGAPPEPPRLPAMPTFPPALLRPAPPTGS
jgi:hypothetical protein